MQPMTRGELLLLLDDIRNRVAAGDSVEGFLNYLMPDEEPVSIDTEFVVEARYRVGNLHGQGGMRMIGVSIVKPPRKEEKPDGSAAPGR